MLANPTGVEVTVLQVVSTECINEFLASLDQPTLTVNEFKPVMGA